MCSYWLVVISFGLIYNLLKDFLEHSVKVLVISLGISLLYMLYKLSLDRIQIMICNVNLIKESWIIQLCQKLFDTFRIKITILAEIVKCIKAVKVLGVFVMNLENLVFLHVILSYICQHYMYE